MSYTKLIGFNLPDDRMGENPLKLEPRPPKVGAHSTRLAAQEDSWGYTYGEIQ